MATTQELEKRIQELEKWKKEKEKQQIRFPLDAQSIDILNQYFSMKTGEIEYQNGNGNFIKYVLLKQNKQVEFVPAFREMILFTAATSDTITLQQDLVNNILKPTLTNGDSVSVFSTEALPAPLSDVAFYYVVNASNNTIKLSGTPGGSAINITDTGTGTHYIYRNL